MEAEHLAHFNSIKVRLELSTNLLDVRKIPFQFHKGAIRTKKPDFGVLATTISIP